MKTLFFSSNRPVKEEVFIRQRAPIRGLIGENKALFDLHVSGNHVYIERGKGRPILFCPGLFGSVYNASAVGQALSTQYRFIVPCLPLYDLPLSRCTVPTLADYLQSFIEDMDMKEVILIGSSMGGGSSLYYALKETQRLRGLILCGSSGLSTIPIQKGFFKLKDFSFVKQITQAVFFDPSVSSDEMTREVFDAIQNYEIVLRSIRFTKSTAKDHLHGKLGRINVPTLLIWGKQDRITPPEVGKLFAEMLPNAELNFIDRCGHVPTQERPEEVLRMVKKFLYSIQYI